MVFNALASLLQVILGIFAESFVLNKLLGYKSKSGRWRLSAVLVFASFSAIASALFFEGETAEMILELLVMLLFAAVPYLLLKSGKKLTFFLFGITLCAFFDFLVLGVNFVLTGLTARQMPIVYSVLYAICILLAFIVHKRRSMPVPEGFLEQIPAWVYVVIYIANLATFYSITENSDPEYFSDVGNALMLISVVLVVACISFAFYRYSSLSRKQKETEKTLELQLKHYEDMVSKNRDIREFRHDYRNNLSSVHALVASGKSEEALEYINNLSESLNTAQSRFSTGNYLADAILSDKAAVAEGQGIVIDFSGSIPQQGISNNDLCTVLANTVDNAIRGCEGSAPCEIKVRSNEDRNGFVLTVSNPVSKKVEIKNNKIKTTKQDKENHGLGVELIRKTAKKYDGFVSLQCENMIFEIQVGFMLKGV